MSRSSGWVEYALSLAIPVRAGKNKKMSDKSQVFRDVLKDRLEEYVKQYSDRSFDAANTVAKGKALCTFYIRDIFHFMQPLDEDDIDQGLNIDGKNDLNIDCILQCDGVYHIFQSKYKGSNSDIIRDEISGFFAAHERITDSKFLEKSGNSRLKEALEEINPQSEIRYYFLTNANLSQTHSMRSEFDLQKRNRSDNRLVEWELISHTEIRQNYEKVQQPDTSIPLEVTIPIHRIDGEQRWAYLDLSKLVEANSTRQTLIMTLTGTQLKRLFQEHSTQLFNWNIRNYLGQNPVNKQISKTIEDDPEWFYYLNNGISAICTDLDITEGNGGNSKQVQCKSFQIINGAQTTMCIAKSTDDEKLKKVRVLLRITKTENIRNKSKGLNRSIVTFNNSQNVIKQSDFRSNDDIQSFLEDQFERRMYYGVTPPKKLKYIRKRQEPCRSSREVPINMETLAKAVYSFRDGPLAFLQKANCIYDTDTKNDGKYWHIFGANGEETPFLPKSVFEEILAISCLFVFLDAYLKQKKKQLIDQNQRDSREFLAYLPKWHYMWAFAQVIKVLYNDQQKTVYNRILDGKAFIGEDSFVADWLDEISGRILECIGEAYVDEKDDSTKGFNFKNWIRSTKNFAKLKNRFNHISIRPKAFPLGNRRF